MPETRLIEFSEKDYAHLVELAQAAHNAVKGYPGGAGVPASPGADKERALILINAIRENLRERATIVSMGALKRLIDAAVHFKDVLKEGNSEAGQGLGQQPGAEGTAEQTESQADPVQPPLQEEHGAATEGGAEAPAGAGGQAAGPAAPPVKRPGAGAPDPARPMTADERAAAKAVDERKRKESGGKKQSVLELFGGTTTRRLNTQTGEYEGVPASAADDPDGPNGLV